MSERCRQRYQEAQARVILVLSDCRARSSGFIQEFLKRCLVMLGRAEMPNATHSRSILVIFRVE